MSQDSLLFLQAPAELRVLARAIHCTGQYVCERGRWVARQMGRRQAIFWMGSIVVLGDRCGLHLLHCGIRGMHAPDFSNLTGERVMGRSVWNIWGVNGDGAWRLVWSSWARRASPIPMA